MKALNDQLGDEEYFGGQLSIADILYYIEINTVSTLLGRSIIPKNTKIETWYTEAMQTDELRDLDIQMNLKIDEFRKTKQAGSGQSH